MPGEIATSQSLTRARQARAGHHESVFELPRTTRRTGRGAFTGPRLSRRTDKASRGTNFHFSFPPYPLSRRMDLKQYLDERIGPD